MLQRSKTPCSYPCSKTGRRFAFDSNPLCQRGFTLVELLVVIGIIVLLVSILLPALNRARDNVQTTQCLSNMRQIGIAQAAYAMDNEGYALPAGYLIPNNSLGWNEENYATLLVNAKYLTPPTIRTIADAPSTDSVFFCPAGTVNALGVIFTPPATPKPNPTSRTDLTGTAVAHAVKSHWYYCGHLVRH